MGNMLFSAPEVQEYYQEKYAALGVKVSEKPSKRVN